MLLWGMKGAPCLAVSCEFKACPAAGRRGARRPGWRRRSASPPLRLRVGLATGGTLLRPPALPLVPGVLRHCGGAGALPGSAVPALVARSLWRPLRSHSPEQRPRRRAAGGGPGLAGRSTPGYSTVGLRRAPSFLSRKKGSQPLGSTVCFVFPRSDRC